MKQKASEKVQKDSHQTQKQRGSEISRDAKQPGAEEKHNEQQRKTKTDEAAEDQTVIRQSSSSHHVITAREDEENGTRPSDVSTNRTHSSETHDATKH